MRFKSIEDAQNFHRDNYRSSGVDKGRYHPGTSSYNLGKFVTDHIPQNSRVLDVGCNSGILGVLLKSQGKNCYVNGIDVVPELVQKAIKNGTYASEGVAEDLSIHPNGAFDIVVCVEVLEHLYDPLVAIKEAKRVLKPKGKYIVSIPNKAVEEKRMKLGDFHHRTYSVDEILPIFGKAGFKDISMYNINRINEMGQDTSEPHWIGFILGQ